MKNFVIVLIVVFLSSCGKVENLSTKKQYYIFGTLVEVVVWHRSDKKLDSAFIAIEESLNAMHRDWHAWELGRLTDINAALRSGQSMSLNSEELDFIKKTQTLSSQSQGFFNPAMGELIHLWGFHTSEYPIQSPPPSDSAIQSYLKQLPEMSDLSFNQAQISTKNQSIWLDFGGIAKGYAIDRAIDILQKHGINNAIVNAGGDLRSLGSKGRQKWKVAIQSPSNREVLGVLEIDSDESVFTSGNYERYKQHNGMRYAHIINPFTGYGLHEIQSATVVAKDGITADAAATALVVAGSKHWQAVIQSMQIDQALLLKEDGSCLATAKMMQRLKQSQLKCEAL